jgi:RNA polymerase sigma-70 factor (ECF subfamily)
MTQNQHNHNDLPTNTSLTLLGRVKQNESDAWNRLVDLYGPMVYFRCHRHWNLRPSDAEHIGQDVFTALARKVGDFQRQRAGSFRKWLRTITDNKCRDLMRGRWIAEASGGTAAREVLANLPDETDVDGETLADNCARMQVIRQALSAIENEFSERDIGIFWSIAVDDRYRQDVAKDLGVSNNTIYIVYSRVKNRLREIFDDLLDDDLFRDLGME